jgi:DNA-binding IclR family transcriptional regulator
VGQRPSVDGAVVSGATAPALDERQAEVLKLLRDEGCGLTVRQIQARLSWGAGETAPVVQELLRLGLISKLNTVIPSYALRVEAVEPSDR